MARPTYWLRSAGSFVDGGEATVHAVRLGIFAPGETVTRVRFSYFLSSYDNANPILNDDAVVCLGIDVSEDADVANGFFPYTDPAEDWMWWEGDTQGIQTYAIAPDNSIVTEMRGPQDRSHRDVKSQRRNSGVDYWSVWLKTESTLAPGQGKHYLGYAASVLVLTAP